MQIISRSSLHIPLRQRSSIIPAALRELRESILARSLLHPPVVRIGIPPDDPSPFVLVAGERRTRAIDSIAADGLVFLHDDKPIMPGEFPVTLVSNDEAIAFLETELEENIIREDLSWPDRVRAIATIHRLRVVDNPTQTINDTAKELADRGGIAGGPKSAGWLHGEVTRATIIDKHLSNPNVANARNANEAYALIAKNEEAKYHAEIIRRRTVNNSPTDPQRPNVEIQLGDLCNILPNLESNRFDLILCDPPYGIGADAPGYRSRSAIGGHQYSDNRDGARSLIQTIITQGFRIAKNRANLFMFLDIDLFIWARDICAASGWVPFRTPLSWIKSESEGLAPWGSTGPRRTIEWILYATKGQRGLIHSPVDALRFARVGRDVRTHQAEKPIELLRYLIECSTIPGDIILDPCCGTGSALVSARSSNRRALGIEIDESFVNIATVRLAEPIAAVPPIVTGIMTAAEDAL